MTKELANQDYRDLQVLENFTAYLRQDIDLENSTVLIYDIEANGLVDTVTRGYCMVIEDFNTGKVQEFVGHEEMRKGIKVLEKADFTVGHNLIDYDDRALHKLYGYSPEGITIDTLTMSRLLFNNRYERDAAGISRGLVTAEDFQVWDSKKGKYVSAAGRHSLASWGLRVGNKKDSFGSTLDWADEASIMSQMDDVLAYCRQDVKLNVDIFRRFLKYMKKNSIPWEPLLLEFEVQRVISKQMEHGWVFNKKKAEELYIELTDKRTELRKNLAETFEGWTETMKKPEYYEATVDGVTYKGSSKGELDNDLWLEYKPKGWKRKDLKNLIKPGPLRTKVHPFNPGSAKDIHREFVKKYDWKCEGWNSDGSPMCGVAVLKTLPYKEAQWLIDLEVVQDRLEKLAEGSDGGYLNNCKQDDKGYWRLHGYVNPLGTVTNRMSHFRPNLGQVPSVQVPYGKEFRSLFTVPKGYKLVGADESAIEMRLQAHYMAEWDDGEFVSTVIHGNSDDGTDAHSRNAAIIGTDRPTAKTFYYGFLYGAGGWKLGDTTGITVDEIQEYTKRYKSIDDRGKVTMTYPKYIVENLERQSIAITDVNVTKFLKGNKLKKTFLDGTPALKSLIETCKEEHEGNKYITSLDGRPIYTRYAHSSCNSLLQSAGAVTAKAWLVLVDLILRDRGIKDYANQVGVIHDELQFEVKEEYADKVGHLATNTMALVGELYDCRCPLAADYKVGMNWYDTH